MPRGLPLRVVALDHVVLNVADAERSLAFYCGELGLDPVRVDEWRRGNAPFPSVRVDERTIIDIVEEPRTGENVGHLCLAIESIDLATLRDDAGFDVVNGPGTRFGARGNGTSVYVRDPDGNTIELKCYPSDGETGS